MTAVETSPYVALRDRLQQALLAAYPQHHARMCWGRARIAEHQRDRLRSVLAHAVEHSPFHARRLAGIDIDAIDPGDLATLPVMTKAQMMADLDDVFTDRRLRRHVVEDAVTATGAEPIPVLGEYLVFASGGSSGERGVFVYDVEATVQHFGALTRGLVARIQQMGGPPPGGLPIAMVAAASPVHQTGFASAMTANGALPFRVLPAPVTLPLTQIVSQLNEIRPPALFGYPTMLARLAAEQRAGRLRIAPGAVTCTSETCTPEVRAAITAGFGAPVIDTFAASEGVSGTSLPGEDVFVLAEDGCIIELVDADDRPVPPGTPSTKVLVTNLYNRVQPLIRYALTDSFVQQPPEADHGYLRARVHGRSDEAFRYGSLTIHPLVVRSVLVHHAGVAEYQIRQTSDGLDAAIVVGETIDLARLRADLVAALAAAGLTRPAVTLRTVPELERHRVTGNLRRFLPLG
ncbi:MAG: hypothetical protein L0H84_20385 [Pseudonocardia sp.]|nr:hypothetical protein [Pseudonocardia sp.]